MTSVKSAFQTLSCEKGPFGADEWETIKRHPQMGRGIVNQISANLNFSRITSDIVLYHEHYDGEVSFGLKEEIPYRPGFCGN